MTLMGKICSIIYKVKFVMIMVLVQTSLASVNVFYKLAASDGMNLRILVAYRFLFASIFLIPFSFWVERNQRPPLTKIVVFQAFLAGLFGGALLQNMFLQALVFTSATYASAMTNLVPAITFVMSLCFRFEKLWWNRAADKLKVLGTCVGLCGAMVLTFYKGPDVTPWETNINLLKIYTNPSLPPPQTHKDSSKQVFGAILALASCFSFSAWLMVQAKMGAKYPCPYSSTAMMSVMGFLQSFGFAICTERRPSEWKLDWGLRLLTVSFTGIVGFGITFSMIAWCVQVKGPLYVSVFNPLMLVLVAIAGFLLLDETLYLGSVLGAIVIIGGLYLVLVGKAKEMKMMSQLVPEDCTEELKQMDASSGRSRSVSSHDSSNTGDKAPGKGSSKKTKEEKEGIWDSQSSKYEIV